MNTSLSTTVLHEGYVIQSSPRYIPEWEKWQLVIEIFLVKPDEGTSREFSSVILYATQQKAHSHGIALGRRLIDGKVEGRSVMDLKKEDRRATPRFRVQFRTTLSDASKSEWMGTLLDLSTSGCRLESPLLLLAPGLALELRVQVPGLEWPLMIDGAHVQWVSGQIAGLAFFQIRQPEQQRLDEVLTNLSAHSE
jgi:hypothetical protein